MDCLKIRSNISEVKIEKIFSLMRLWIKFIIIKLLKVINYENFRIGLGYLSTATLMINSKIVSAVSEERFTRQKNEEGYPMKAINFCLDSSKLKSEDLDAVGDL